MDGLSKTILESVLSLPTMSFHETAVSTFIRWYCAGLGLDVKEDKAGNLIVKYSGKGGKNITLTAHMDHPGFEVISAKGKTSFSENFREIQKVSPTLKPSIALFRINDMKTAYPVSSHKW